MGVRKGPSSRRNGAIVGAGREGLRNRLPNVGSMTAAGAANDGETPRMLLVFDGVEADEPIRPVQVAAILGALEEIFVVTLIGDAPPSDYRERDWVWNYDAQDMHVWLDGVHLDTALEVLIALPWHVYTVPFSAFAYGVAHVFGPPARSAPLFDRSREDFWTSRLAGGSPTAEWLEWQAWLEYKHEEVARNVPFQLGEVDIELTLPPEPEPEPDAPPD